jgi:hypothetical protein
VKDDASPESVSFPHAQVVGDLRARLAEQRDAGAGVARPVVFDPAEDDDGTRLLLLRLISQSGLEVESLEPLPGGEWRARLVGGIASKREYEQPLWPFRSVDAEGAAASAARELALDLPGFGDWLAVAHAAAM